MIIIRGRKGRRNGRSRGRKRKERERKGKKGKERERKGKKGKERERKGKNERKIPEVLIESTCEQHSFPIKERREKKGEK